MNAHQKYGYGLVDTDLKIEAPEMALGANAAVADVAAALRHHLPVTRAHALTLATAAVAQAQRPNHGGKFAWEKGDVQPRKPAGQSKPATSGFAGKRLRWIGGISNPHREGTRSYAAMQPIAAAGADGLTYEEWLETADPRLNTLYGAVRTGMVEVR